jgi:alkanesulfonate monooxygenase SsuD/methylene tetrahydromethanopterin reductase-like flavin-dependent oxidoreductase (luciferase family)
MQVIGKALGFDPVGDAVAAEQAGFDGVRVIDHLFSGLAPDAPHAVPHALAGLAAAAVATERVVLTQTMLAATMRHPAECAQAVASIDRISGGRAEIGLGAGWYQPEHTAMGLALGSPRDRVDRVVEAATICRRMLEQSGRVEFKGRFFRAVCEVEWEPTPHVPVVMVGASRPALLRGAARVANRIDLLEVMNDGRPVLDGDHVNDVEHLQTRIDIARNAAAEAGNAVVFSATMNIVVVQSPAERDRVRAELASMSSSSPQLLDRELLRAVDTADGVLERFARLAEIGIDRVHVRPRDLHTQTWLTDSLQAIHALT